MCVLLVSIVWKRERIETEESISVYACEKEAGQRLRQQSQHRDRAKQTNRQGKSQKHQVGGIQGGSEPSDMGNNSSVVWR